MIQTSTIGKKPCIPPILLGREFRLDLTWWCTFLEAWNGISFLRAAKREVPDITITSDALGVGGVMRSGSKSGSNAPGTRLGKQ